MSKRRTFTDEELTAYLDGEATERLRTDIAAALKRDNTIRKRLDGLAIDTAALKSAFDALLPSAPKAPNLGAREQATGSSLWTRYRELAATALLCLAVGWGGAAYVLQPKAESWQDFAATYHALYVNGTLIDSEKDEVGLATELKRVSSSLGKSVNIKALSQISGLNLKRAQILGFEDRPLMQVAFLSKAGAPVALCIMKALHGHDSGVEISRMRGMSAATWSKGDYEYLLVGGSDGELIRTAALAFSETL
jgi:hypothetical protein